MKKFLFFILFAFPLVAFAAEVNPALESVLSFLGPLLGEFAGRYPWLGKVLTVMLWARIIIKPIMSALLTIGQDMPDGGARKFLRSMSDHVAYKVVAYLLDWFGSVKLPKK